MKLTNRTKSGIIYKKVKVIGQNSKNKKQETPLPSKALNTTLIKFEKKNMTNMK